MKLISQEILNELDRERQRQEAKFPGQVLPATGVQALGLVHSDFPGCIACVMLGIPDEEEARRCCDIAPDWSRVLVEEVSEAIAAAGRGNAKHAREELIQVAAVALRFIEAIDRGEVGFDA